MNRLSLKNHLGPVLLVLLAIGISCFSLRTAAQANSPGLFTPDSPTSNTVSANQLLSSDKALRTTSRARQFLIDGRLDKAQKEITNALHASPNCAIALDIQAAIYLRTGHFDDAAAEFQKAIDADPTIGQAYVGLGILLIAHNEYKDALVPLDRAESLLPTTWLVYFETSIAHLALGNLDDALKQIKRAEMFAARDPEKRSATAYLHALVSIKSRDFKSAIEYMNDAIKFNPNGSYAKPALAKIEQLKPLLVDGEGTLAENSALP